MFISCWTIMLFYFWFSISISICICITKIINQKTKNKKQKTNNRYSSLITNLKQCKAMNYPSQEQHKELVETKTRIQNVRWNESDWNCKSIWHLLNLIQVVVVVISEDLKGKLYSFFFFFRTIYFFLFYVLLFISFWFWFWFSNKNLTNKINNRHSCLKYNNVKQEFECKAC